MQELCETCWREAAAVGADAEIVVNFTSGQRKQSQAIAQVASVYGCQLVYADFERGGYVHNVGPDPRKQFMRVMPNLMGQTFGVVGLYSAHEMFADKSFYLAR